MKRFLTIFILMSLFIHWSGYWGSLRLHSLIPMPPQNHKSIEVSIVDKETLKSKELDQQQAPIRFTEAPKELIDDSLDLLKKKVDLLSEKVQRVKKETRAQLLGMTKNRWNSLSKQQSAPPPSPSTNPSKNAAENKQKLSIEPVPNPIDEALAEESQKNSSARGSKSNHPLEPGLSTFGNQLNKNIEVGAFTALNTDYHLYSSFYSRIEEMIRPPWEERVSSEAQRLYATRPLRPKGGWTTRMDVILNANGKLLRVSLLKSSGVKGFDDAAINAFQKADFFPHPPKGIVNEDGLIVLKYLFTVF